MNAPLRLGIAGLGTVGAEVIRLVRQRRGQLAQTTGRTFQITAVSAADRTKDRGVDIDGYSWYDDAVSLARDGDIDVFVELIGGEDGVARASLEAALAAGRPVVTANKALLAVHGASLARAAEERGVALNYEGAVGGGIPVIKALREGLVANRISRISGILNGTCNFILSAMDNDQREFAESLREAQDLGYAEADPAFDVGGFDTAHKLAILTSLAFGTEIAVDDIYVEGIENVSLQDIRAAGQLGYRIKLLGVAQDTGHGIEQRVHPALVAKSSPMAEVAGVFNAVSLAGDFAGDLMIEGLGAGAGPTASAVVSDIADIALGNMRPVFGRPAAGLAKYRRARMRAHEGGYYIGLQVFDRPGSVAGITQCMADQAISLESIIQRGGAARRAAESVMPVALVTYETKEQAIRSALEAIERAGHLAEPAHMIRIEAA